MARRGTFQGPTGAYEVALSSIHPPDNNTGSVTSTPGSTTGGGSAGSGTPATGGTGNTTGDPATVPPTPVRVDYTAQIAQLQKYIANLQAVAHPTAKQQQELITYIARLADYRGRV